MKKFLGLFATISLGVSASTAVVSCDDKDVVGDLTLIEGKTIADIISASKVEISRGTLSRAYEATEAKSMEWEGKKILESAIDGEIIGHESREPLRALFTETKDLAANDASVDETQGFAIQGKSGASNFVLFYLKVIYEKTSTSITATYKSLYKMTVTIPTS